MQILLFVITMLLLLTAITYAKMDSYKSMVLFRKRFEVYSAARNNPFEKRFVEELYNDITMSSKDGSGEGNGKAEGICYISLAPLVTPDEKKDENKNLTKKLLRDLIVLLYEGKPFYQELLKQRPSLANDIVEALDKGLQEMPKIKNKTQKIEDIANIELKDPILEEAYYKMLKGFTLPKDPLIKNDDSGYPSLLSYLTLKSGNIRVFLAPKPLLMILFGEDQIVDEVLSLRTEIYRDLINNSDKKPEEGKNRFADAFSGKLRPEIPPDKVDFSVSKTNPARKERVRFL